MIPLEPTKTSKRNPWTLVVLGTAALCLLAAAPVASASPVLSSQQDPSGETCYIVNDGDPYDAPIQVACIAGGPSAPALPLTYTDGCSWQYQPSTGYDVAGHQVVCVIW